MPRRRSITHPDGQEGGEQPVEATGQDFGGFVGHWALLVRVAPTMAPACRPNIKSGGSFWKCQWEVNLKFGPAPEGYEDGLGDHNRDPPQGVESFYVHGTR